MERLLVISLILVCVIDVQSSPYGYGTKGGSGSAAKADAKSFAGALSGAGNDPFPLPNSGSYSGSYSKSSSSSFAASSAISSASSFSVNGQIGANGINVPSSNGCQSGCQNGSPNEPDEQLNFQPLKDGNSATAPCSDDKCLNKVVDKNCGSSGCGNAPGKCSSGECKTKPQDTSQEPNDILVNTGETPKSIFNAYNDLNNKPHDSNNYLSSPSEGNKSPPYSGIPSKHLSAPYETPEKNEPCSYPNCKNTDWSNEKLPSSYNVPIGSYINKPSVNSGCIGNNCQVNPNAYNNQKCSTPGCTSSVPQYSPSASTTNNCASGNCAGIPNNSAGSPATGTPHQNYNPLPNYGPAQTKPLQPSGSFGPTYNKPIPSNPWLNCGTAGCSSVPASPPSSSFVPKPESVTLPPYTGGFGGPSGLLKPNDGGFTAPGASNIISPSYPNNNISPIPAHGSTQHITPQPSPVKPFIPGQYKPPSNYSPLETVYNPINSHVPSPPPPIYSPGSYKPSPCTNGVCSYPEQKPQTFNPIQPNLKPVIPASSCSSENCGSPVSPPSLTFIPPPISGTQYNPDFSINQPGQSGSNSPSGCSSGNCNTYNPSKYPPSPTGTPLYTPSSCTSGNCGTQSKPEKPFSPPYNSPTLPTGAFKPNPCTSGNCGTNQGQPGPSYNPPKPISTPSYNPVSQVGNESYKPSSCSSGNCGSPASPPSLTYNPPQITGTQYKPDHSIGQSGPTGCSSGNCNSYNPPSSTGTASYTPSSCTSGNCGTQTKPEKPISPPYNSPTLPTGAFQPNPCTSGNCGTNQGQPGSSYNPSKPISSPSYNPVQTENGSYKPSSCTSGNCGVNQGQPGSSYNPSKPISSPSYNPVQTENGSYKPVSCTSGNCGVNQGQPGSSYNPSKPISSPSYNPIQTENGSYKPVSCTSGNCGVNQGQPGSSFNPSKPISSPSYNPVHTENGSYKPSSCTSGNCDTNLNKLPEPINSGISAPSGQKPNLCSSGNCGQTHDQSANTASAADASANSIAYTGGFGGPPGLLKPYDDGTLGNNKPIHNNGANQPGGYNGFAPQGSQSPIGKLSGHPHEGTNDNDHNGSGYGGHSSGCSSGCGGSNTARDSGAAAKSLSVAAAGAGSGSAGYGGSFSASSASASAHASSGATKGGYSGR